VVGGASANWDSLVIELVGGNSATPYTVIDVEYFYNVEFQMSASTALQEIVPPDPSHNPTVITAKSKAHQSIGSFVKGGVAQAESFITSKAGAVVDDVLTGAMDFLFGML